MSVAAPLMSSEMLRAMFFGEYLMTPPLPISVSLPLNGPMANEAGLPAVMATSIGAGRPSTTLVAVGPVTPMSSWMFLTVSVGSIAATAEVTDAARLTDHVKAIG